MHIAKEQIEVRLELPGAVIRQQKGFGGVGGYNVLSGEYFSLAAGVDTTPLFRGLDGNMCQCPHWGYVLRGRITTTDAEGQKETVESGDLSTGRPATT